MKKPTPSKPNATPAMALPRSLDYPDPDRWPVDTTHGPLRCDGTTEGRLARLEDVARFVMGRYDLTATEATAWLCDSLEAERPVLYVLRASGNAEELQPSHSFAVRLFIDLNNPAPASAPADCGLVSAIKHMRQYWDTEALGKAGAMGEDLLDPLAVHLRDAFNLWGYGVLEPAYKAADIVQPLESWQQQTGFGFMGVDSTLTGRLVRLADVVKWLADRKSIEAVEVLCSGLNAGALGDLYKVNTTGWAERQPANYAYGFSAHTVAPGLPALLRRIRETWGGAITTHKGDGDVLDATTGELAALAIRVDVAHGLWGWGGVEGVQANDSAHPVDKDAALLALLDDYEKRGNVTRDKFATAQNLSEANFKKRLQSARALRKKSTANPWVGLSVVSKKSPSGSR